MNALKLAVGGVLLLTTLGAEARPSLGQRTRDRQLASSLKLPRPSYTRVASPRGSGLAGHVQIAVESAFDRATRLVTRNYTRAFGWQINFQGTLSLTRFRFKDNATALQYAMHHANLGEGYALIGVRNRRVITATGPRLQDPTFARRVRRLAMGAPSRQRLLAFVGPYEVGLRTDTPGPLHGPLRALVAAARQSEGADVRVDRNRLHAWISTEARRHAFVRRYFERVVGAIRVRKHAVPGGRQLKIVLRGAPKGLTRGGLRIAFAGTSYLIDMELDKENAFRKKPITQRYTAGLARARAQGAPEAEIPTGITKIVAQVRASGDYTVLMEHCPRGRVVLEAKVTRRNRLPSYFFRTTTEAGDTKIVLFWNQRSTARRLGNDLPAVRF